MTQMITNTANTARTIKITRTHVLFPTSTNIQKKINNTFIELNFRTIYTQFSGDNVDSGGYCFRDVLQKNSHRVQQVNSNKNFH